MFYFHRPDETDVARFLTDASRQALSYPYVGLSLTSAPAGWFVDHTRRKIGSGRRDFEAARSAVREWKMFDLGWLTICGGSPPAVGQNVSVLAEHFRFWSLNACRVIYLIGEDEGELDSSLDENRRYGFAYGTLESHCERGEERFLIEWQNEDDGVYMDIFAFSLPANPLVFAGLPIARVLQRKFAREAIERVQACMGE